MSLFLFSLFIFFYSTYKWNNLAVVFLCLISRRTIPSRFIHVIADNKISSHSFLRPSHISLYVHSTSLSIHLLMTIKVLPYSGYYKWCCTEHKNANIFSMQCFGFLCINTQNWNFWVFVSCYSPCLKVHFVWYTYYYPSLLSL